ncbi:MAG: cell surface protein SprA [Paludibacteraceae bacterium]|nr:cell surface protein SprA [Paludibacteraceae bacterium]
MRNKLLYILIALLPFTAAVPVFAQNKPKTLKELVAEEKAQKEREKAEKAAQEAAAAEKAKNAAATQDIDNTSLEAAADIVTLTDSAIWAPTNVHQLGTQSFDEFNNPVSSLDLRDPDNISTTVEYQPETGTYVLHTRIGDTDVTTPYMLTQEEYNQYAERQIMHRYWQQKISEVEHNNETKFDITDMKFNIGPADKVFGPGGVQLKMQGSAELLFGFKHQYIANPSLTLRARNNNIFDFDEKIQASIQGKVGSKMNFNLSYNTEASFSFDQQNLKLNYKGEEDDIIQSIEAGNVTMDLNSSLIRGSKALFGIKTNLKFGKFRIQALISQQNSEAQTVSSKGGAQMTKFDISGDSYDENRHFFLSHFFRDNYEKSMASAPYIASGVTINKIEVWVTNKRGNYDQARNIVAFTDLGENSSHTQNTSWGGAPIGAPDNNANGLYSAIRATAFRDLQQTSTALEGLNGMEGGSDFEKIESARLLTSSEYTLNSSLGYISLKSALNQDEVLAVAYEYTYNGQVFQVGEFSTDGNEELRAPNALALKMLKSSANAPTQKNRGTWDLMMKNIYSLGATSINQEKFELYVTYRNDSVGTDVQYLNEGPIQGKQLIRVMNLDRLDSKHNASPDGRFDFLEGLTVYASGGKIIFPVLEPFGEHLASALGNDPRLVNKYCYQELYDSTLVVAQEISEKNKFHLTGKYKGTNSSEIRLGAMNVPRGSVTVTAGGATLIENVDYTVDYTMGTVTILNSSILESGTNVDVRLESQSTFSLQRKSLFGAHLEYEFNKDFIIGGTIMHLRERPLTTKVNTGSEPLANTIWGVNGSWKTEMQWLTNAIDQIPWITATAPSTFSINAEFAHLIPGHTNDVGTVGTAYIDDFEATTTNIDVHYPSYWFLAATPTVFAESKDINLTSYNKNRALLSWYSVDPIFGYPQTNTPAHIRNDVAALSDHRTRIVYQDEIYPNRQEASNVDTKLAVLNLSFYPDERGQYNISASEIGADGHLTNPRQRWGGIMRRLDNTDFEKANIEYIQFWLMDPGLTNPDGYEGELVINLGDISEDILRDGKKAFEHGLPISATDVGRVDSTVWGYVPRTTSTVVAFSNETGARAMQDVGLNGLSTTQELTWPAYQQYLTELQARVSPDVWNAWGNDEFSPRRDPAGDNFHYYRGSDFDEREVSILNRYKHYNGTEGNSPATEQQTESYGTASTLTPDVEDINLDNTLNEYEKYYQYKVILRPDMMEVGRQHITEKKVRRVTLRDGSTQDVTWYQFKIPLRGDSASVQKIGSIRNWKSIRFMRMYLTGCEHETHLRFATLDLVRGDWRQYTRDLAPLGTPVNASASIDVQTVNIEENSTRTPVNYVLPPGVSRQTDPGQAQLIAQNEQAMVMRVMNLSPHDARAMYKNTGYDMRQYKNLQMFVHAEQLSAIDPELRDGDLTCFIRLGTDLRNNYYEYEIPLHLTEPGIYNNNSAADREAVWPTENMFDFPLKVLTEAKIARNKAKRAGNEGVSNTIPYVIYDDASGKPQNKITVVGNPTLEEVTTIMIGVRNNGQHDASGEVWVNELRLSQFNEQGGVAAMANAALAISDIAQVNVAGRLETAGYGSIESNVLDRNLENFYQLSVSAALEAGRLFPEQAKIQMPLYVSYSNETTSPDYDPLDTDVKLSETLGTYDTKAERDSIKRMSNTVHEATSFSVSNFKVNIHSKNKDMFYDPANFSISASYNKQLERSPEMEINYTTDQKGSFQYAYSFNPKPWEPFAKVEKVQNVKFLKEMNFYYLPQSWAFNTNMHRTFSHMKMRDLAGASADVMDLTFSKDFTWDRNVDIKYDLTKNMKFSFQSAMNAIIDEGKYTPEILTGRYFDAEFNHDKYEAWRDTIQRSLARWGSPYTYQQVFTASWNVPFARIPGLDALTANGSYNATYNWTRTASTTSGVNMGNTVSSLQSWQVDGGINFETWYGKSKYWKSMTQRYTGRNTRRSFKPKNYTQTVELVKGEAIEITHRLNSEMLTVVVADSTGKAVPVTFKAEGNTKLTLTPKADCAKATVTVTTRDPNERTPAQVAGDMFAYIGTMFRRLQVTYRETNSMTIPGFEPEAGFMGQRKVNGAYAPGYDFAFGFIPNDMIERAKQNGWLSGDTSVVQPATRAHTSDFDIKLTLEPLPGLKVQLNGKRYMAQSTSIIYSYDHLQENMTGSFNITQVAIGTLFSRVGSQEENFANAAYDAFLANRVLLTDRVQDQYTGITLPSTGFMSNIPAGTKYDPNKHGRVNSNSADVLVPAFLAAYTGRDANSMNLNPFLSILRILPNWSITYDGLGKLPWMRDHFKSVTLTHAYTCKYAIGSFGSYSTWIGADGTNKQLGFVRDVTTDAPRPSSAYDISSVTLTEAFSPLIGINMTMKNSLSLKAEYRKQRNLALNVTSVQLTEGHTDEFVIGAGYTIKNLNFITKKKDGGQKKVSNDLKLQVDVSYKDVKMLLRKIPSDFYVVGSQELDRGITQASSGNKVFAIKISADYVLSQKINLQLFYDHQGTTPLISSSYPVKADNIGLNIKLMLTR